MILYAIKFVFYVTDFFLHYLQFVNVTAIYLIYQFQGEGAVLQGVVDQMISFCKNWVLARLSKAPSRRVVCLFIAFMSSFLFIPVQSVYAAITWTEATTNPVPRCKVIANSGSILACAASYIPSGTALAYSSDDGDTWTSATTTLTTSFYGIAYGQGVFVAVGVSGNIYTSTDGASWTSRTSNVTTTLEGIVFDGSRFVVTGSSKVLTSADGVTWTATTVSGVSAGELIWNGSNFSGVGLERELESIQKGAKLATNLGLIVHAGHGLTLANTTPMVDIAEIEGLNIGHAIVADAFFVGLKQATADFKALMKR